MRAMVAAVAALAAGGVVALVSHDAWAGANRCSYNGQTYDEGVVICQAGLRNECMNGEWQSKGSFCNGTPDGAVVGGGAVSAPVVIEVPAPAAEAVDDD